MSDGRAVAFLGLGKMGAPMARRLVKAGVDVIGFDPLDSARAALALAGGRVADTAPAAVADADDVVLMLPSSAVIESLLGDPAVCGSLRAGTTVIDMSSSEPLSTRHMAAELATHGIAFVDAPVSGGVRGAEAGTLTIMCGGEADTVAAIEPLLRRLGTPTRVGPIGAGHALKAINNLLAAVHLLAAAEGLAIGKRFGLDPELMLSVINRASGRSEATETKLPRFVLPETYDSGFAMRLMIKDMRIATELAATLEVPATLAEHGVDVWTRAAADLGPDADQTDIARWVSDG
ncbi:NAD(P)-dependent oxidoreductase [Nocardia canadensis]|uniref:NAD(P)-dependent oxidoreductase n=1 Tax=Nocardia canadensis TaxID=3065238 RepID=UPI00292E81F5|nr:NAD(P)-dependent oxidoreductase [Nocardia canadensis]